MKSNTYDVIVIGGGPAGMMAAGRAAELGARVLLLEQNARLGKKLSITGGGRCNITNAEFNTRLFLENFPKAKQFLYSPFSQFSIQETFDFFEERGLPLKIEARKRAFPKTENAEDVVRVMEQYVKESGRVTIQLETRVLEFIQKDKKIIAVKTSSGTFHANAFILATGGAAAPKTGSSDNGVTMAGKLGHTVTPSNPNLVPLQVKEHWVKQLAGVTISDMRLTYKNKDGIFFKETGRLLFTHFGISGPLVINSAQYAIQELQHGPFDAYIDFFPEKEIGELDKELLALFEQHKNKDCKNVLPEFVRRKIADHILAPHVTGLAEKKVHSITKEERRQIIDHLKGLRFTVTETMGLDWAIRADGGIEPKEVNFSTMQSRLHENFYPIGDTLNINRPSGGFSLQLCWTMGFVAGTHAAEHFSP